MGARPYMHIAWDSTKACDPLEEHFNANTYPSAVNIPHTDYPAPNPPTSVTGQNSPTGDGYEIDWHAPTTGIAPAFYRIYRDGYNYTDRYDETDDAATTCPTSTTCSYTDPRPGTHTYYVTAVSLNLQESDPVPLPPATFP